MGTAYTAISDDGSAIYYNPAGFAFQAGTHMQMDAIAVVGLFRFFPSETPPGTVVPSNGYSGSVKPHFIPVGTMAMSKRINEKLTAAFGLYVPYGLAANFTNFNDGDPDNTKFVGRFAGTRAALQAYWFQPTVAYKITPSSALAIGVALVHTHLTIESSFLNPLDDGLTFGRESAGTIFPGVPTEQAARSIARLLPNGRSRVAGTANSPGFTAGYMFKHAASKTSIGLNWRSPVTSHLHGEASFAFDSNYPLSPFIGPDLLPKAFPRQAIKGSFTTPANYGIGIANSKYWNSTFSFDFRLQDFTRFSSVPLNFSETQATNSDVRTPAEQRLVFNFRNSFQVAFGYEKRLNARTQVRAGYMFDRSPVVDAAVGPLFPDASRNGISGGVTRMVGNKEFSLFYEGLFFLDRTVNVAANDKQWTNGEYKNYAHVIGAGLRFNLRGSESTTH
jgi:long-chain fatty acid transport protein